VESVRISGGGAKSAVWKQILADVFAKRVATLASQEGSAYGAALLAMVGTGAFSTVQEACRATIHEVESVQPRAEEAKKYEKLHRVFQAIYPALKPIYGLIE
jgi:xylulokinase